MAGRAGAILPIALGVVLARWGGAVGAPRPSQRLRAAAIPSWAAGAARRPSGRRCCRRRGVVAVFHTRALALARRACWHARPVRLSMPLFRLFTLFTLLSGTQVTCVCVS